MNKTKKILFIVGLSFLILMIVVVAFISPISKYLIEKYDKKFTGREITLDWAYVNPFTGYIYLNNVEIKEHESDLVFLTLKGLSVNVAMIKLFYKEYEFTEVTLNKPRGFVKQVYKEFNFNDLIERFSNKSSPKKQNKTVKYSIQNIKIIDGVFYYKDIITPINYFVKKVNIESKGISWDVDSIPIQFSFESGIGSGDMKGDFSLYLKKIDYKLKVKVKKFDLNIVGQYIKDLSNYGSFRAYLDADFVSEGNLKNREDATNSGYIKISDFHFGKTTFEDYASFESLEFAIHELSPKKLIYFYDSIALHKPYFKYEKYDSLDNVQTAFGKSGANIKAASIEGAKYNLVIEIAKYIKVLSKNFLRNNYRVDRLAIYDGDLKFNDFSLNEKFSIDMNPFNFTADSIDKTHQRVNFDIAAAIKPYGKVSIGISINPKDSSDFDLKFNFQKLPATMFNPYLTKYTSFPLDRGTIEINGNWHVKNGVINSNNHLVIIDPRMGNRIRNNNSKWLPMRLIMFVIRERGNVIDYEIPIQGDLKNPKFRLRDVIFDALGNVFIKPPSTPYRIEVRNIETAIEKSLTLTWETGSSRINNAQENFIEAMVKFLKTNPDAKINIGPNNFESKEREHILLFEAKKKYFLEIKNKALKDYTPDDSIQIEKMSIKDGLFVSYLNHHSQDSLLFTIQDKCNKLLSSSFIDAQLKSLNQNRINVFMSYFSDFPETSKVQLMPAISTVPYNGYSFYKISYQGEFPEKLLKAYGKMNRLNNEAPRDKYKRQPQRK